VRGQSGAAGRSQRLQRGSDRQRLFRSQDIMQWINIMIQGGLTGGLYALMAVGLSLAFGIMRLVNIAHGDLTVLAAFMALTLAVWLSPGSFFILPLTVVLMAVLGYG